MANLLSLISVLLKHGNKRITPYDYQKAKVDELQKIFNIDSGISALKKPKNNFILNLLAIPYLGPVIAILSYIKFQIRHPRFLVVNEVKNLGYYRISKSGCTSIQSMLIKPLYPDINFERLSNDQIHYISARHMKSDNAKGILRFSVVRNPISRIISCYNDKVIQERNDFFYFQDYMAGIIKPDMDFETFLEIIKQIPDRLKDMHFRPQYLGIPEDENIKIFRLEDQKDELNIFLSTYGINMPHRHKTEKKFISLNQLTANAIKKIHEIYQRDFERFGYTAPI